MLLPLLLLACSGKDDSQKQTDDSDNGPGPLIDDSGDTGTVPCRVDVEPIRPVAGDDDAYYRADVEFKLSEPDKTAVVGLITDPDGKGKSGGTPVAGTQWTSIDQTIAYFTPDEPLDVKTDYRSLIDWCNGHYSIPFHTSTIGTPVKAPKELLGTVWDVDLGEGRWIEPRGAMDGIITNYLTSTLLMSVELVTEDWIEVAVARTWEDGTQNVCFATADFSPANFTENPYFSAGPKQVSFIVAGVTLVLEDFELEGSFKSDGSGFEWVEVKGVFDTRPLDLPIGGEKALGAACAEALEAGSVCIPCDDGKPYCLVLDVDEIVATPSHNSLRPIAEDCSDPECKSAECAKKWD